MLENNKMNNDLENVDAKDDRNAKVQYTKVHPPVDIEESKEDFIFNVDMPGVDPDDITINLDADVLTLEAKSVTEGLPARHYYRQFRIMRGLDASKCRADYKLGVLTLKLAKPATIKPQQIKIQSE